EQGGKNGQEEVVGELSGETEAVVGNGFLDRPLEQHFPSDRAAKGNRHVRTHIRCNCGPAEHIGGYSESLVCLMQNYRRARRETHDLQANRASTRNAHLSCGPTNLNRPTCDSCRSWSPPIAMLS